MHLRGTTKRHDQHCDVFDHISYYFLSTKKNLEIFNYSIHVLSYAYIYVYIYVYTILRHVSVLYFRIFFNCSLLSVSKVRLQSGLLNYECVHRLLFVSEYVWVSQITRVHHSGYVLVYQVVVLMHTNLLHGNIIIFIYFYISDCVLLQTAAARLTLPSAPEHMTRILKCLHLYMSIMLRLCMTPAELQRTQRMHSIGLKYQQNYMQYARCFI